MPQVDYEKPTGDVTGEPSSTVRERVSEARSVQRSRFNDTPFQANADMGSSEVWKFCTVEEAAYDLDKAAMEKMNLSARAFHRTLKIAQAIAALAGAEEIGVAHFAEAIQYRQRSVD